MVEEGDKELDVLLEVECRGGMGVGALTEKRPLRREMNVSPYKVGR